MATAIRWFSVFRKKTGIPTFSQLRWEMLGLGGDDPRYLGERAAEWVSDKPGLSETHSYRPTYRPDGGWGLWTVRSVQIGHTIFEAGSVLDLAKMAGAKVQMFCTKYLPIKYCQVFSVEEWEAHSTREIDLAHLTEKRAAQYWAAQERGDLYLTVKVTASIAAKFRIDAAVGFLYPESQIKKRFLSDCWSGRNRDGSLSATREEAEWDPTVSWHSECFVQGRPTGVVLGYNPHLDQAWVKKIQGQARSLAKMNGLPIYAFAEGRRDAAGLRRIN